MSGEHIAEKLIKILKLLKAREKEEWEEAVKKSGADKVVPLERWNLTSGIEFCAVGVNGTAGFWDYEKNRWHEEPVPKTDTLWLVYYHTIKEFDGLDLSANKDLLEFFQKKGERRIILNSEEGIREFCL